MMPRDHSLTTDCRLDSSPTFRMWSGFATEHNIRLTVLTTGHDRLVS